MCGIFGYCGKRPVDLTVLKLAANEAARRGPYAFGFAWLTSEGLQSYHERGSLRDALDALDRVDGARMVIGNARLATTGSHYVMANNQPLILGDAALSHNGNVYSAGQLNREYDLTPRTETDSETILLLAERFDGDFMRAIDCLDGRSPMALLLYRGGFLSAYRRGHPLYVSKQVGVYFSSRAFSECTLIAEDTLNYQEI